MKACVIVFPASNCDRDMKVALEQSIGSSVDMVWHRETDLSGYDLVAIPGGFSYGDYLRCGAMAARSPIMAEVVKHAKRGGPVLGVCNGFQVLCESGLAARRFDAQRQLEIHLQGRGVEGRTQRHRVHRRLRRGRSRHLSGGAP